MGELINLRRRRKAKARCAAEADAAQNRIAFGRSKATKTAEESDRALATLRLDGHLRQPSRQPSRQPPDDV